MAENKKSFVFYCDWIDTFKALPKDKGYDLLIHLLAYVNDENPITEDVIINAVFQNIKNTLKRDLKRYEARAENSRENGKKGGRPPKPKKPSGLNQNPPKPKKPDSVSVSDSVNDNVIIELEILKNEFLNCSNLFFEAKAMERKSSIKEVADKAITFWNNNYILDSQGKDLTEIRRHFGNWLDKQEVTKKELPKLHPGMLRN